MPVDCLADPDCPFSMVSSHRGLCGDEPENTLAGFLACQRAGVPMIEIDTQDTADGVPVLMHDGDVERTTDGASRYPGRTRVAQLTAAEFATLVVDDPRCAGDASDDPLRCRPPTFAALLAASDAQLLIFLDFKGGEVAHVADAIVAAGAVERVLFFDTDLDRLHEYRAIAPAGLVCPRVNSLDDAEALLGPEGADLELRWLHTDAAQVDDFSQRLDGTGIRQYFDIFIEVDLYLGSAEMQDDPAVAADHVDRARRYLLDFSARGGAGLGSNYAEQLNAWLYPEGFGL